ncbi:MAG: helix-turn-helix domain-containing protein [Acidimicrobiales bacterium]
MLVPEDTLARRRDAVAVIGAGLVAKANGAGHRRIAEALGRPASTVRGWLRRFAQMAQFLREHFTRWAHALSPGHGPVAPSASTFDDAVEAAGVLGAVAVRRFGPRPPWSLISVVTGGRLLSNTSSPFPQPM